MNAKEFKALQTRAPQIKKRIRLAEKNKKERKVERIKPIDPAIEEQLTREMMAEHGN